MHKITFRRAVPAAALLLLATSPAAGAQDLELVFSPSAPEFEEATAAYESLWATEGAAIVEALQRASGLVFAVDRVEVTVFERPSFAGYDRMGMRASYPPDTKRATLAHELGHILIGDLIPEDGEGEPEVDHHRVLFLFLYEAWVELWGSEFAREQVAVESRRRGIVDYEGIWNDVLSSSAAERRAELDAHVARWRARISVESG